MGIQINGNTDSISATDGGLTVSGADLSNVNNINVIGLNATGIITATQVNVGTGVTIFGNTGIVSATEFRGNGANLTGVGAFAAGTLMLFQQTAAPTGWTKQTTHNNKTLRVVTGAASSGGTTAFTTVFASRTPAGTVSVSGSNSGGSVTGSVSGSNSGGSVTGSVTMSNAAVTLTSSQIPSHSHTLPDYQGGGGSYASRAIVSNGSPDTGNLYSTNSTGGGGSHTHSNTASWSQGTFTNPTWSGSWTQGTFTNPTWTGSASFSGTALDFAVQYVDLIIASKD